MKYAHDGKRRKTASGVAAASPSGRTFISPCLVRFIQQRGVCLSGGALATPLVSRQAHASVPNTFL